MEDQLSRRGVLTAGWAALGAAAAEAQNQPVNLGMIGVGLRSAAHLRALAQLQNDSKVADSGWAKPTTMVKASAVFS